MDYTKIINVYICNKTPNSFILIYQGVRENMFMFVCVTEYVYDGGGVEMSINKWNHGKNTEKSQYVDNLSMLFRGHFPTMIK